MIWGNYFQNESLLIFWRLILMLSENIWKMKLGRSEREKHSSTFIDSLCFSELIFLQWWAYLHLLPNRIESSLVDKSFFPVKSDKTNGAFKSVRWYKLWMILRRDENSDRSIEKSAPKMISWLSMPLKFYTLLIMFLKTKAWRIKEKEGKVHYSTVILTMFGMDFENIYDCCRFLIMPTLLE